MTNILLVLTGGTIGSTVQSGTINTDEEQSYKLLNLYKNFCHNSNTTELNFKSIQPTQLLSENIFPTIWELLIKAIEAEDISNYQGIIITHGTDTLAFTAAALSLYFHNINIPVLLVSSDYPLGHTQANGLAHFICAVEFIKQRKDTGVFVPYKNQNSATLVHLGTHIASSLQLSGDFFSVQFKAYLRFENKLFYQQNAIASRDCLQTVLMPRFSTRTLLIRPYPGLDYSHYNLNNVDVVLHDLYHSGTACSTTAWGENHSLTKFIEKCNQFKVDFYMAPAIKTKNCYASTKSLVEQGAIMIWNLSLESAYAKLLLAYGNYQDPESINQFLEQNIAFEHIP